MKKYFSLALFMVMVLTFVGTVPAVATEIELNVDADAIILNEEAPAEEFGEIKPLDDKYPFISLDFSDASDVIDPRELEGYKAIWSEVGMGGVDGSFMIDRKTANAPGIALPDFKDLYAFDTYNYKVSCWIKVDKEQTSKPINGTTFGYVMYAPITDSSRTFQFFTMNSHEFSSGDWVYTEIIIDQEVWNNTMYNGQKFDPAKKGGNVSFVPRFLSVSEDKLSSMLQSYEDGDRIVWHLDDFRVDPMVPEDAENVPVVSNIQLNSTDRINNKAVLTYDYAPVDDAEESNVVVRVSKKIAEGKYATIDQFYAPLNGCEYTIPEIALNAELKYEIIPYDKTEKMAVPGTIKSIETSNKMIYEEVVTANLSDFAAGTKSITGSVNVLNYKLDETDINLFSVLAFYDANGALVQCNTKPIVAVNGTEQTYTHSVVFSDNAVYEKVASAKMFVWGGSGFEDTTRIAYTDVLEKTK